MTPYDMKRELKQLYAPKNRDWQLLMIPPQRFIAVDGHGDPNTAEAYAEAVTALYGVAYVIKFACKREATERDFVVAPLEGLWYTDDASAFTARAKALWSWTLLIAQPSWVTDAMIDTAIDSPRLQKAGLAGLEQVHVENIDEGLSAQLLHVGSYDDEAPALKRLHDEFLPHHDLAPGDPHHEIYLSDPRKTERAKLKTVLRQPVVRAWPDADPNTSAAEPGARAGASG